MELADGAQALAQVIAPVVYGDHDADGGADPSFFGRFHHDDGDLAVRSLGEGQTSPRIT